MINILIPITLLALVLIQSSPLLVKLITSPLFGPQAPVSMVAILPPVMRPRPRRQQNRDPLQLLGRAVWHLLNRIRWSIRDPGPVSSLSHSGSRTRNLLTSSLAHVGELVRNTCLNLGLLTLRRLSTPYLPVPIAPIQLPMALPLTGNPWSILWPDLLVRPSRSIRPTRSTLPAAFVTIASPSASPLV